MSTVPAMPPTPAESMTPVSPPTELAPSISDDVLYEVVDGQVVVKTMGTFETDIASLLDQILGTFAMANRLGRVFREMIFRIDLARTSSDVRTSRSCPMRDGPSEQWRSQRPGLGHGPRSGDRSRQSDQLSRPGPRKRARVLPGRSEPGLGRLSGTEGSLRLLRRPRSRSCGPARSSMAATSCPAFGSRWPASSRTSPSDREADDRVATIDPNEPQSMPTTLDSHPPP